MKGMFIMKVLKNNQLVVLVIALMFVAAGYLSYTTKQDSLKTATTPEEKLAAIGDAALVSSGEIIEKEDKDSMLNNINSSVANSENNNVINNVNDNSNNSTENENENTNIVQTATTATDSYFANSRIERETMYSQMIESYQKLLESTTISQEQKAISQEQINKINQTKNGIMIAENLIKTKGFTEVIIFIILAIISSFIEEKVFIVIFILSIISTILINSNIKKENLK